MREHHRKNIATYDRDARALAEVYNKLATKDVLPGLDQRLPPSGREKRRRALDLGCGSGRDAFWLANARGFEVVAVDASAAMLDAARKHNGHPRVKYVQDTLPDIAKVVRDAQRSREKFDVFILSAVWMHLQADERRVLMQNVALLAKQKALVYISLRHGQSPADRPMFANEAAEVRALGSAHGARFERIGAENDKQGRGDVKWEYVALKF